MTGTPSRPVQGRPKERRRTVHIVIHRLWIDRTVAVALLSTGGDAAGRGSSQLVRTLWARDLVGHPRFVVCRRSVVERHWQKLTVFCAGANRSATLPGGSFSASARPVTAVASVECRCVGGSRLRWFDPGKSRQYPRTVARTWRHGCDPELHPETAPVSERDEDLPTAIASTRMTVHGRDAVARRNEE